MAFRVCSDWRLGGGLSSSDRSGIAVRALQTFERRAAEDRDTDVDADDDVEAGSLAARIDLPVAISSDFSSVAERNIQMDRLIATNGVGRRCTILWSRVRARGRTSAGCRRHPNMIHAFFAVSDDTATPLETSLRWPGRIYFSPTVRRFPNRYRPEDRYSPARLVQPDMSARIQGPALQEESSQTACLYW